MEDSRSISRSSTGFYMNPEGNSLFVSNKRNGITLSDGYQFLTENEGQMGGNCSIEDTDYKANYRVGYNPSFINYVVNYDFAGINGNFDAVASTDRSVPLVPGFSYPVSDATLAGLNGALNNKSSIDFFKSKAPFGDRGERTNIALADDYLSYSNYFNADNYTISRTSTYDGNYNYIVVNEWPTFRGTYSNSYNMVSNLGTSFEHFGEAFQMADVDPNQSAVVFKEKYQGIDTDEWVIDLNAITSNGNNFSYSSNMRDFTLNSHNGKHILYGKINTQGEPMVRRDFCISTDDQAGTDDNFITLKTPDGIPGVGMSLGYNLNLTGRNQSSFGGTFAAVNNLGTSAVLGALPGLDPTIPILLLFRGANPVMISSTNNAGSSQTTQYGANGSRNTLIAHIAGQPNRGGFFIYGEQGDAPLGFFYVDADEKSILAVDEVVLLSEPEARSGEAIAYGALSGGEMGAYDRGTGQLFNGEAYIRCPDHFQQVADPLSMTVTVTPLSADSKGIAVIEKTLDGFRVKELFNGTGSYSFDYMVTCKRKGHESYEVMRQPVEPAKDVDIDPFLKNVAGKQLNSITDIGRLQREGIND